jgi:hypothetical protein
MAKRLPNPKAITLAIARHPTLTVLTSSTGMYVLRPDVPPGPASRQLPVFGIDQDGAGPGRSVTLCKVGRSPPQARLTAILHRARASSMWRW